MFTRQELQEALPPKMRKSINDDLVLELNSIIGNPDMYERYRENLVGYVHILQSGKYSLSDYLSAVMYVSYKMMGLTNAESFAKTFPDRMERYRLGNKSTKDISSFSTAYSKTKLVTQLLTQTLVPVHILNADLFQESINKQAQLMRSAKSEKVQHEAAKALMDLLRPPEETKIKLDLGVTQSSVIQQLTIATEELVLQQRRQLELGTMNARDVAESRIITVQPLEHSA